MKLKHILLSVFVAVGFALAVVAPVSAEKIPSAPTKTHIADNATIIDDQVEAQISQTIFDYEKKTGNQIAVYTFNSLDGNSIENYCHDTASKWGVGSKAVNNGAVLCVAVKDRKVRIEVGRGLEPSLTDLQSNLIIKQKITPAFKKNDYSGGIKSGVDSIIAVIGGGSSGSW